MNAPQKDPVYNADFQNAAFPQTTPTGEKRGQGEQEMRGIAGIAYLFPSGKYLEACFVACRSGSGVFKIEYRKIPKMRTLPFETLRIC
jgi:hypothetical protein